MASEDNYKEGVDFVWVDKGGYKTRKFLTRAEKAAKAAPDKPAVAKPKAKAKEFSIDMASKAIEKSKGQPMSSSPRPMARPVDKTPKPVAAPVKISVTPLPMAKTQTTSTGVRPEGKAAGMPQAKKVEAAKIKPKDLSIASVLGSAAAQIVNKIESMNTLPKPLKGGVRPEVKAAGMPQDKTIAANNNAIEYYRKELTSGKVSAEKRQELRDTISLLQRDNKRVLAANVADTKKPKVNAAQVEQKKMEENYRAALATLEKARKQGASAQEINNLNRDVINIAYDLRKHIQINKK